MSRPFRRYRSTVLVLFQVFYTATAIAGVEVVFTNGFEGETSVSMHVVSAVATNATTVVIQFTNTIDPLSIEATGNQFTFDNGLNKDKRLKPETGLGAEPNS